MNRWFKWTYTVSYDGNTQCVHLTTRDGRPADHVEEFTEQLAHHVLGYAMQSNPDLDHIFNGRYQISDMDATSLSRRSVERLLSRNENGEYRVLKGFTGECLSHWAYETFNSPVSITTPKAHSSEPAYDLVALIDTPDGLIAHCAQAKVTAGYAGSMVHGAVNKYQKLHEGNHDYELANEIRLLAQTPSARSHLSNQNWRQLLLDPLRREYAIILAYDGVAPDGPRHTWSSKWAAAIPGPTSRRILITLELDDCNRFIEALGELISANSN